MLEKGCLLLTKIKTNTVNTYFVCEILKILIGNIDEEKSDFLSFSAVDHILSETEIWPFSTASPSTNSTEMQH